MWVSMWYKAWPWIKNICSPDAYNSVVELKTRAERKCCGLRADADTSTLLLKGSAPWDLGQGRLLKASKILPGLWGLLCHARVWGNKNCPEMFTISHTKKLFEKLRVIIRSMLIWSMRANTVWVPVLTDNNSLMLFPEKRDETWMGDTSKLLKGFFQSLMLDN